ncbi:hypothetical protein VE04_06454 [Pseudogymnoascus sp. 24MN13]|nr:hypothetical protein VE04_06454 [Pseudogymnoascus sp. 24MN13]
MAVLFAEVQSHKRHNAEIKRTRNIGIIAHIDAGKTTTTERMLYYSGVTRRIGDVDDGSTVTDFLPAERARGITIQSAAVTLHWPPLQHGSPEDSIESVQKSRVSHTINLIDTPGHADFTFEVLRSLRILDGAICVLDGVAGVEAQTEKVWAQANLYSIPRIAFVNKLDRDGAAFGRTVKEIGSRLRGWPAVCQIPWWEGGKGRFQGVGDAVDLCALKWPEGGDGKAIQKSSLESLKETDPEFAAELAKARLALVEVLCEFDEHLLTTWLECDDDPMAIAPQAIRDSLRRCIIDGSGRLIPVFAGASFRNIGVQPLLDAVDDLLPDPNERPPAEITAGALKGTLPDLLEGKLHIQHSKSSKQPKRLHGPGSANIGGNIESCALAFKVVNDPKRGVLVYVRVYSGTLNKNSALWNTSLHVTERAGRLLQMYASDAKEIQSIPAGQIGVIVGLKHARTGDTLITYTGSNAKSGPPAPLDNLHLRPIDVPPPVFFAAIEPHSLSEEKNVEQILALLLREDPSLHVSVDDESGQMLLSGMGELHLEIARDRLVNDFKAKATMGAIEIGYRECVQSSSSTHHALIDREIAGKKGMAGCSAFVEPVDSTDDFPLDTIERDGNFITVNVEMVDPEDRHTAYSLPQELPLSELRTALINGASAALARGPRRRFPMTSTHANLTFLVSRDLFGKDTHPAALSSAAHQAVQTALKETFDNNAISLMEPVMDVVISCDEGNMGNIVHDISSARGGHVVSLGDEESTEATGDDQKQVDVSRIYAPPDPFAGSAQFGSNDLSGANVGQQRHIRARVPLKEMVGYLKHLRSLTGGRGTFIMAFEKFERVSGQRERDV